MPENNESPKLNLSCPYCGSLITIEMETVGGGYSTYERASGIICDGEFWCGAEWDSAGVLVSEPRFVLHPDVYEKPYSI